MLKKCFSAMETVLLCPTTANLLKMLSSYSVRGQHGFSALHIIGDSMYKCTKLESGSTFYEHKNIIRLSAASVAYLSTPEKTEGKPYICRTVENEL